MLSASTSSPKFVDATTSVARRCAAGAHPTTWARRPCSWPTPPPMFHTGDMLVVDGGYTIF